VATDEEVNEINGCCKNTTIVEGLPESKILMWQQVLAILYKNRDYWKRNWPLLLSMFLIVTVALCGIFFFKMIGAQSDTTKVSMAKLLNPQVLCVAGTSRDSPKMKRLIELFTQNVERDHGTFIELQNQDLNKGKSTVVLNL
jgi:hypothetical protein